MTIHDHQGDHAHAHAEDLQTASMRSLVIALTLTSVVFFAELIGGVISGSMALLADAMHMLADATGLIMAVIAVFVGRKAASRRATYGYRGVEVMAAAINAVTVIIISVWIVVESVMRVGSGTEIRVGLMLSVAVVGLLANAASAWVLSRQRRHSLNVEGAFLHVIADLLGSIAVIGAAAVIHFTGFTWADTVASVAIAALVLPRAVKLLLASLRVLLDQVPDGVDIDTIQRDLAALDSVEAVHDLHVWSTSGTEALATCHLVVPHGACTGPILDAVQARLREHGIQHSTIQIEHPEHLDHEHVC
ncbi:cation diffusion facilitator family transporter [Corynebacterium cystitidis]|uniref:cation diffusion facilitator family transporter n=1 Tax=Corynebacterium cystitidis TaxID=35757 RepID=UPI00211EA745|nr:cation diffusion facilitator family transporter [Corynebacterium cystitidis]